MAGPTLSEPARAGLAARAERALARQGIARVRVGEVIDGGSPRSLVVRATAEPRRGDPLPVVLKASLGASDRLVRECAALTLAREHRLPGTVRLLGVCDDPALLVLEDLGECASVADRLLGDDALAAERAVIDWAATLGRLQAAGAPLRDAFAAQLEASAATLRPRRSTPAPGSPAPDPLSGWLRQAIGGLGAACEPFGIAPSPAALEEVRSFSLGDGSFVTSAHGLVPGDSCPDNALCTGAGLTLIDFESAAHQHVAWEAAYLIVPWPTCWCSWALPAGLRDRALGRWREIVAPTLPAVASEAFDDDLARAAIGWTLFMLRFQMQRAMADPEPPGPPSPRPRPEPRSLVLHRLARVAELPTTALPALRALAAELHEACRARWGERRLELAPALRDRPPASPADGERAD